MSKNVLCIIFSQIEAVFFRGSTVFNFILQDICCWQVALSEMASKRGQFLEPERPLEANSPTFGFFVVGREKSHLGFLFFFSMGFLRFLPGFGMSSPYVFPPMLHLERWGVWQMVNGSTGSPGRRAFQFTPKSQRHIGDGWWEIVYGGFITNWDKWHSSPHVESSLYTDDR